VGSILVLFLDLEVDHLVNFFRTVSEKSLQITDETIHVPFSSSFQNDILVVVIPEREKILKFCNMYIKSILVDSFNL
jgi:hypothetical protein